MPRLASSGSSRKLAIEAVSLAIAKTAPPCNRGYEPADDPRNGASDGGVAPPKPQGLAFFG